MSSIEDFDILEKLGSGTFGNVYKARRKVDSQIYALKRVDLTGLDPTAIESAVTEAHILAQIHSKLIISYYDSFFIHSPRYELVIVTEYVNGGTLSDVLSTYTLTDLPPEPLVWSILIQLITAVYDLHCARILHRCVPQYTTKHESYTTMLHWSHMSLPSSLQRYQARQCLFRCRWQLEIRRFWSIQAPVRYSQHGQDIGW